MVSFWKSNEIERWYGKSKWSRFLLILPSLPQFKMAAKNREREQNISENENNLSSLKLLFA